MKMAKDQRKTLSKRSREWKQHKVDMKSEIWFLQLLSAPWKRIWITSTPQHEWNIVYPRLSISMAFQGSTLNAFQDCPSLKRRRRDIM